MGLITKTIFTGLLGASSTAAFLAARNPVISPLAATDSIWTSNAYRRYNPAKNPATQDVCVKRIPLSKIRPDLLQKEGDLAVEFCRGVWSGLGFDVQRKYLEYKYRGPETATQLWDKEELAQSTYEKGTCITDHFEVVDKTPEAITIRCGDTPRNQGLRGSDGLFIISAVVDKKHGEVELGLKSCLFISQGTVSGAKGPMPGWMEELHQWYSRIWSETGARNLLK